MLQKGEGIAIVRVAAYCRVSTDKEDQANSFESQQRYFQTYIQRNPEWSLQNIYADEGISGTSTRKRTQFNAMIAAARAGELDLILTKEVSRFARNTLDTLAYTRELRRYGVGVLFLIDNIDTRQQEGELRLTLMSSLAQEESRKTSQRVKWGQTRQMEQGVVFGGSLLGYDVTDGVISIDPEGAKVVQQIFHKYLNEHKGTTVIARELREEGILSSRGNCKWSASTVLKILKNEKYCGDLVQKKTYTPDYLTHEKRYNHGQEELVILRNHHAPIIDRETWEAVQRELRRRSRRPVPDHGHGNRYPLSGKIQCGVCGSHFLARQKKTRSGTPYQVWRCGKAVAQGAHRGCQVGRQIREQTAMELFHQVFRSVPLDWDAITEHLTRLVGMVLQSHADSAATQISRLELELEEILTNKQRALEAFLGQSISQEDFLFLNHRWDSHITELRQQLAAVRKETVGKQDAGQGIRAAIQACIQTNATEDNFCTQLLDHMTISADGRVEVTLRFLSARWVFALVLPSEREPSEVAHSEYSVPISVNNPLSSG